MRHLENRHSCSGTTRPASGAGEAQRILVPLTWSSLRKHAQALRTCSAVPLPRRRYPIQDNLAIPGQSPGDSAKGKPSLFACCGGSPASTLPAGYPHGEPRGWPGHQGPDLSEEGRCAVCSRRPGLAARLLFRVMDGPHEAPQTEAGQLLACAKAHRAAYRRHADHWATPQPGAAWPPRILAERIHSPLGESWGPTSTEPWAVARYTPMARFERPERKLMALSAFFQSSCRTIQESGVCFQRPGESGEQLIPREMGPRRE